MNLAHSRVLIYFYVFIVFQNNVDEVFSGNPVSLYHLLIRLRTLKVFVMVTMTTYQNQHFI